MKSRNQLTETETEAKTLTETETSKAVFGEDKEIKKGLQNFAVKLIDEKVKEVGWEFPEGENYLAGILRKDLISSAVANNHPE